MHLQCKHLNFSAFFLFFLLDSCFSFRLASNIFRPFVRQVLDRPTYTHTLGNTSMYSGLRANIPFLIHRPSALLSYPFEDNWNLDLLKPLNGLLILKIYYPAHYCAGLYWPWGWALSRGNLVGKSFSEYLSWHVKVWFVLRNSNTIPGKGLGWPLKSNCL